jgi:thiamine-monophosphate kinase
LILIGGDTVKGSLSLSIQINGVVSERKFLRRDKAQEGELLCVTGHLGLAALGLKEWREGKQTSVEARKRFLRPQARLEFASHLYEMGVRSAIDISDGLLSELKHICKASELSCELNSEALVVHSELATLDKPQRETMMLCGGDDYELCFSLNESALPQVVSKARAMP